MHEARKAFTQVFGIDYDEMRLIYDVAHNVAKFEHHDLDGTLMEVCVHRKGATRAFGPRAPGIPREYAAVGQPVLIPGSMGTSSYLLHGTATAMQKTWGSTCHGAGRVLSRSKAKKEIRGRNFGSNSHKRASWCGHTATPCLRKRRPKSTSRATRWCVSCTKRASPVSSPGWSRSG